MLALALTHTLDDPLLGSHDGAAAELSEVDRDLLEVPDLEIGIVPAGLFEKNLTSRILHFLDHFLQDDNLDVSVLHDLDLGFDRPTEASGERSVNAVADKVVQLLLRQRLVRRHHPKCLNDR